MTYPLHPCDNNELCRWIDNLTSPTTAWALKKVWTFLNSSSDQLLNHLSEKIRAVYTNFSTSFASHVSTPLTSFANQSCNFVIDKLGCTTYYFSPPSSPAPEQGFFRSVASIFSTTPTSKPVPEVCLIKEYITDPFQSYLGDFSTLEKTVREYIGSERLDSLVSFKDCIFDKAFSLKDKTLSLVSSLNEATPPVVKVAAIFCITALAIRSIYKKVRASSEKLALVEHHQISRFSLLPSCVKSVARKASKTFFRTKPVSAIFNQSTTNRMHSLLANVKKGLLQNVLLLGPSGTGKTMFAKEFAKQSGMNYLILSGKHLAKYAKRDEKISELDKLLDKAEKSSKPTIVVVDDFDELCQDDTKQVKKMRYAIEDRVNTSSKLMFVFTATESKDFDRSLMDNMDYKVQTKLPGLEERAKILRMYAEKLFTKKELNLFFTTDFIQMIAANTYGFTAKALHTMLQQVHHSKVTKKGKTTSQDVYAKVQEFIDQERTIQKQTLTGRVCFIYQDALAFLISLYDKYVIPTATTITKKISFYRD